VRLPVAVAQDVESAELLGKVAQRRGFDLPESKLGPARIRRFHRRDHVGVAMARHPQDQVGIPMQPGDQRRLGDLRDRAPHRRASASARSVATVSRAEMRKQAMRM
jgi:hypothetical protein